MKVRGFSLVELLIVIVILFILGTIAFPDFNKWRTKMELKSFVYSLSFDIAYARDYARKNGVRVIVAIVNFTAQNWLNDSNKNPVLYVIFADKNRNGSYDAGDVLLSYGKTSKFKVIKNTAGDACFTNGRCVTFYPVGPPRIGAVPAEVEFKSLNYDDIKYTLRFRSITGITEVVRD